MDDRGIINKSLIKEFEHRIYAEAHQKQICDENESICGIGSRRKWNERKNIDSVLGNI